MGGLVPPTSTHSDTKRLLRTALVYGSPLLLAACCVTASVAREVLWLLRAIALSAALGLHP